VPALQDKGHPLGDYGATALINAVVPKQERRKPGFSTGERGSKTRGKLVETAAGVCAFYCRPAAVVTAMEKAGFLLYLGSLWITNLPMNTGLPGGIKSSMVFLPFFFLQGCCFCGVMLAIQS
jgi:hypothetical protein